MAKPIIPVSPGDTRGRLTVLGEAPKDSYGHFRLLVRCECGKEYITGKGAFLRSAMCADCAATENGRKRRLLSPGDTVNGRKIIEEVGKNEAGAILYKCVCENCGAVSVKTQGALSRCRLNRCSNCPPDYHFKINNGVAEGVLPDGTPFFIDPGDVETVGRFRWHITDKGYITRGDKHMPKMMLHWFVLGYSAEHAFKIDHINRNKCDCRKSNLREVSAEQNSMNGSLQKNSKTGYSGVFFHERKRKYISYIGFRNKRIYLGTSSSAENCAAMYNYAAELLFGEYAGHRNPVEELSGKDRTAVFGRCKPYLQQALTEQQPCNLNITA